MHVRRLTVAAIALLLPLTSAACGGDDDTADSAKTTAAADSSTTTAAGDTEGGEDTDTSEAPDTTMTQAQFDEALAAFNTSLDEAGDDFCKITTATDSLNISSAETPEQAKAVYEAFAAVLTKVADHLPADSTADSDTLKAAAEQILSDAEADGYDPKTLEGSGPAAFNDPDVMKSMTAVSESITKDCANG